MKTREVCRVTISGKDLQGRAIDDLCLADKTEMRSER